MKAFRSVAAAVILTALPAVPAQADDKRFGGYILIEPFYLPVPGRPLYGRWRHRDGYPVGLVRQRLRGIGFSGIGRFEIYRDIYSVAATDPGGVRVMLAIDRWTGDIVQARVVEAGPAMRRQRPPAIDDHGPLHGRTPAPRVVTLRAPPLPRPAPQRRAPATGVVVPVTTLQGERFDPADTRPPIATD